jgi:hypothetical protein
MQVATAAAGTKHRLGEARMLAEARQPRVALDDRGMFPGTLAP